MQAAEDFAHVHPVVAEPRQACTICHSRELLPFLDLGTMPPANALRRPQALGQPEPAYPLGVCACTECQLIQLTHSVPASILFKDYVYFSSISQVMVQHFAGLALDVLERFVPANGLVVEIGSNDGILLQSLVGRPCRILGVDPADAAAAQARERGVPTMVDFFNAQVAQRIRDEHGPAAAILGNNVLAHIPDLHETIRGFAVLAADDGVLVLEFPYVVDFLQHGEFDTIYHEHLYYLGLQPLGRLLSEHGFRLFDVRRQTVHGGSVRVFACRTESSRAVTPAVGELLDVEADLQRRQNDALTRFREQAMQIRADLVRTVNELNAQGHKVIGYTAPAKGNVLLNFCSLGPKQIAYLADATPAKQGLLSPGTHIPIVPPEHFQQDTAQFAVLLAWNHKDEVLRRESAWRDRGGKFIIPIPNVHLV
jgi:SAM-dependent methyltransferase